MTCINGHPLPAGAARCATCGAPAARLCANGHPLAPGFQLCSACGAFAAAPAGPVAAERPVDNTWVYFGCGVAIALALGLVAVLVLRWPSPQVDAAGSPPPKTAPSTATTRPAPTTTTTTRPAGGAFEITPERLKAELESQGMPRKQADCIVDGLVEEGVDLSTFTAPTDEQQRLLVEIATRCAAAG